jgi:hypothetical protein
MPHRTSGAIAATILIVALHAEQRFQRDTPHGHAREQSRHGTEAIAAELAGLQARVDQLAGRISALETSVNCLILLVERIAQS